MQEFFIPQSGHIVEQFQLKIINHIFKKRAYFENFFNNKLFLIRGLFISEVVRNLINSYIKIKSTFICFDINSKSSALISKCPNRKG